MMFIGNKIYHPAIIFIFYCLWSLWAIISLSGCSGNIPSADRLVSGKVTLSWDEVPGATSYNVYGSTSPNVTKLTDSKFRNVPNPFTLTQLQPGKTYYFVVTAVTDTGESKESKELSYTATADTQGKIEFGDIANRSEPIVEASGLKPEAELEHRSGQVAPTRSNTEIIICFGDNLGLP
jgi:fibronectin type 3 domain-containing protein